MAFTVQTDDGLTPGANAYIDVAFFKTYHTDRGQSFCGKTDLQIQSAIIKGSAFTDGKYRFNGSKLNGRDQVTEFPRSCLYDKDGYSVDGIPAEVKNAVAEYSLVALTSTLAPAPETDSTGMVLQSIKEKVGPIEEERSFFQVSKTFPSYPSADLWLERSGFVSVGSRMRRA